MTVHVVTFSGGAGSWAAAKRVAQKYGAENTVLLFADVLMEDEDLYRFLDEAAANVGAPLVRISQGLNPWAVFEKERYIGNSRVDPCSKILKRNLLDKWRDTHCNPADTVIHVGLSWWEPHRWERIKEITQQQGWTYNAPLFDEPQLDPEQVLDWMRSEGLRPPRLYELGFTHNNCGGFCVKAGHASFARLLRTMPERYAMHEALEGYCQALGINGTILKDRRGGTSKPMTLKQFRLRLENKADDFDCNDEGGCGCALAVE